MKKMILTTLSVLALGATASAAQIKCDAQLNNGNTWTLNIEFDSNQVRSGLNCEANECSAKLSAQESTVSAVITRGKRAENFAVEMTGMDITVDGREIKSLKLTGPKIVVRGRRGQKKEVQLYLDMKVGKEINSKDGRDLNQADIRFNLRGLGGRFKKAVCKDARI